MDFSRYEKLRTLVRANFSEQTRALVDEALVYADGKLTGLCRYDGTPLLDIKPFTAKFDGITPTRNGWQDEVDEKTARHRGRRGFRGGRSE